MLGQMQDRLRSIAVAKNLCALLWGAEVCAEEKAQGGNWVRPVKQACSDTIDQRKRARVFG